MPAVCVVQRLLPPTRHAWLRLPDRRPACLTRRQQQAAQQPNGVAARTPSRKLSQLHSAGGSTELDQHQQQQGGLSRASTSSARRLASSGTGRSSEGAEAAPPGGRPPAPPPQPGQSPPRELRQQSRVAALRGSRSNASIPDSAASLDSDGSGRLLEVAAATAAAEPRQQGPAQPLAVAAQQAAGKDKGKSAAMRFLSRLGSRKDKYKAKERGMGLQVGGWWWGRVGGSMPSRGGSKRGASDRVEAGA